MPSRSEAQRRKMAILYRVCERCGKEYEVARPSQMATRKYCSHACANAARTVRYSPPKNGRICEYCGESFMPNGGAQRFCKECVPDEVARRRLMKYGVSGKRWAEMLEEQGGKCALCDSPAVHQDHDHKTGNARRPLCVACNIALARVEQDGWLGKAVKYLAVSQSETAEEDVLAL
ncbi:MAG: endonuclease VII domain-containing protein [Methanocellales archaeon]|nr:endonuclease VII domain-containing protein [Methanocellales archaeon]